METIEPVHFKSTTVVLLIHQYCYMDTTTLTYPKTENQPSCLKFLLPNSTKTSSLIYYIVARKRSDDFK